MWAITLVVFFIALAACSGWGSTADRKIYRNEIYLPPAATLITLPEVTSVIEGAEDIEAFTASPCVNNLAFIEDQTIPDGMLVSPGEPLHKIWVVENRGTCNWDEHYRVKLVTGPQMGTAPEQALFPARSGARAAIRVRLIAPLEPGTYRSAWQAFDPDDQPFGDTFFVEIEVQSPSP